LIVAVVDLLIGRVREEDGICRKAQGKIQEAEKADLPALVMRYTITVAERPTINARKGFRRIVGFVQFAFDAVRRQREDGCAAFR
jgi:hypothetical protein